MKRFCEENNIDEVSALEYGMDFREPQYRREVFLRFYEYHLKYQAHAGAVYYAFPAIFERYNFDREQKLWFCFINGCSQHVLSTWEIFNRFPDFRRFSLVELEKYFDENYKLLGWDIDRRYQKKDFIKCVENYREQVFESYDSQGEFFDEILRADLTEFQNFDNLWFYVREYFVTFGRLATFSYLEYLRIAGENLDCSNLFFDDLNGSKSHRNGLCKVLGRDDYDWHDKINPTFKGNYTKQDFIDLAREAEMLLSEARERFEHKDISYFTLETTLCCYKSWHRPNRRYPNVYNDMFYERIKKHELVFGQKSGEMFWEIRREKLPDALRLEANPADVGLNSIKQNHYLNTGQVIMMDKDWSCFKNDYNDWVDSHNEQYAK